MTMISLRFLKNPRAYFWEISSVPDAYAFLAVVSAKGGTLCESSLVSLPQGPA